MIKGKNAQSLLEGTDLSKYVAQDVQKQQGVSIPVRAGFLERMIVRKVPCEKIHANADDLFTSKSVGPSYRIISKYQHQFLSAMQDGKNPFTGSDPLLVEKLQPEGYRLLNGHHRWAAAMRVGIKRVPVRILNLATESDIRKILEQSTHDKRAALDLEEVIFRPDDDPALEKELRFPKNLRYKQRIRLGIPALFYELTKNGYDIWVYAAEYYSIDDIRDFFQAYSVHVDGIITGITKKQENNAASDVNLEKLITNKYDTTLHIDNDMVLLTRKNGGSFEEYELNAAPEEWSKCVIKVLGEIKKHG
ncbi:MAG: ParB N-terminal domain-containing protein [Lachnospiraceae bacterium]|nr:ParB N-terminal domain-containing protein [Lachnospiraceae bacterium]